MSLIVKYPFSILLCRFSQFGMPCLIHIMNQPPLQRGDGPIGLFLVPTRELAQQVAVVTSTFGNAVNVRNVCVYGGAPKGPQLRDIDRG